MNEFKTISDIEFNKHKNLLEEYKIERETLKQNYHDRSKILTSKIHELEHIVTKEDSIRNKRGQHWVIYKKAQILKLHKSGMSNEDIANKFETTINYVINTINNEQQHINRRKLHDFFKKTNGIINDSLEIDVLFRYNILTANKYKNKGINTLADFYKNIKNLTKSEIKKVESEIEDTQNIFKYWIEQTDKEWRYNG